MFNKTRFLHQLVNNKCLHTTSKLRFKFKLTDELSRDYDEKQKAKLESIKPPEQALHTKENPIIMGRVSHDRYQKVVKIGIPKHRFNDFLTMYIKESDNVQAYDENDECNPGDWVLLRRTNEPLDENVNHKVEKIIYRYGNYVDPITGRRSLGLYFEDDYQNLERIKLD